MFVRYAALLIAVVFAVVFGVICGLIFGVIFAAAARAEAPNLLAGGDLAPQRNTAKPAGEWNAMKIDVEGEQLTVTLNGEVVNEVDLSKGALAGRPKTGAIGFQDHALPVKIRNFRITR